MIACIGWGSLIWRPEDLPLAGGWANDGPTLPVEFARQSRDGRVTLVITDQAMPVRTLWAPMLTTDLEEARQQLREREATYVDRIAVQEATAAATSSPVHEAIRDWLREHGIEAAIWTALDARWQNQAGRSPTQAELIAYLRSLDSDAASRAEMYVRRAPAQVRTVYRAAVEAELGWTPVT